MFLEPLRTRPQRIPQGNSKGWMDGWMGLGAQNQALPVHGLQERLINQRRCHCPSGFAPWSSVREVRRHLACAAEYQTYNEDVWACFPTLSLTHFASSVSSPSFPGRISSHSAPSRVILYLHKALTQPEHFAHLDGCHI